MQELRRTNTRGVVQTILIGPDDKPLHIQWILKALFSSDGNVLEVEATGHEQSRLNQLVETLDLSTSIIQNATDGILLTDKKGRILSTNKAFSSISGYHLTEVIGKPIQFFRSNHHTDDFFEGMIRQVKDFGIWQGEMTNVKKTGEIFPSWVSIQASKDSSGQITNYIFYLRDITEVKFIENKSPADCVARSSNRPPKPQPFHQPVESRS